MSVPSVDWQSDSTEAPAVARAQKVVSVVQRPQVDSLQAKKRVVEPELESVDIAESMEESEPSLQRKRRGRWFRGQRKLFARAARRRRAGQEAVDVEVATAGSGNE